MFGTADWATVGIILTIVSTVATLTWWLSGQFSALRHLFYERIELTSRTIIDKLEYHERHDDDRFSQIRSDLSEIRIRNAAKDALMTTFVSKVSKDNKDK